MTPDYKTELAARRASHDWREAMRKILTSHGLDDGEIRRRIENFHPHPNQRKANRHGTGLKHRMDAPHV